MKEKILTTAESITNSAVQTFNQLKLLGSGLSLRTLLINRFTIVLLVSVLIVGAAQGYVAVNSEGTIQGTVVDSEGNPVEDAEVSLVWQSIEAQHRSQTTTTDLNGQFLFEDQDRFLEFRISAAKEDVGSSEEKRIHLLYEGQPQEVDFVLE
jgi:hypothetical protein